MKNLIYSITRLSKIGIFLIPMFFLFSCEDPDMASSIAYEEDELHAQQGMGVESSAATVSGIGPFSFAIAKISTTDGINIDEKVILINSSDGKVSVLEGNILQVGTYTIDIAVSNDGGTRVFKNALKILIFDFPSHIIYSPTTYKIGIDENLITNAPMHNGSSAYKFTISNQQEVGDAFCIDEDSGVVTVDGSKSVEGIYDISLMLSNEFGTNLYPNVLRIEVSEISTSNQLRTYLIENNLDLPDILNGWITAAPPSTDGLADFLSSYHIMDIRSASSFNEGHIEGAVHSSLASIVQDAAGVVKPILVVCYTGQTSSYALVALRLSGFTDTKVLKWGMSGWNSSFADPWMYSLSSQAIGHVNWTKSGTEPLLEFAYPSISSTASGGAEILAERVMLLTTGGYHGISGADVLSDPEPFAINAFFHQADVDHYGNLKGAVRVYPMSLSSGTFRFLDPSKVVVSYCWTGQTTSLLTAYLRVLGYDAKCLKYGFNNLIYSDLESHMYKVDFVPELPFVIEQ